MQEEIMRYFLTTITIFCSLISMALPASAARVLVASGNSEAPPIVWKKGEHLVGVAPEALHKILTRLGVPYELRPSGSWDEVQNQARAGKLDLIVSAYDNADRRQYMDFSLPYLKSPVVIVVNKGKKFPCPCRDGLIGKKGAANVGESFGQEFDTFIHQKLDVRYVPYQRAFEMMRLGTVEYLIMDLYPAIIYSQLLNVADKIDFLDTPATIQQFHFTIARKSPFVSLMPKINAEIKRMKAAGEFQKMAREQYRNWFKTFQERQRFFARAHARSKQDQAEWDAGARERGLDNMARFIERDIPYMTGSNTME